MRRCRSSRLDGYAAVAAVGLVAALALRRPELAIVAAPFALVLAAGTALARDPGIAVEFTLATERTVEREEVEGELVVRAARAVDRLELLLDLPRDVEVVDGVDALAIRLRAGEERVIPFVLRTTRWGLHEVGNVEARARDPFRLVVWEARFARARTLKAYPRLELLTDIVPPVETQAHAGSEVARTKGDGIEYADIREYVAGDRVRSINWRASARRGDLVVNERHPERNTDVVLFVDSFTDVRADDRSTLDDAVRATASLAGRYLERRDRVGLIAFGGILRWLQPGMGLWQRVLLVETLLETGIEPTYTWREVSSLPARILPSKALVFAITPLVDSRFIAAVEDLRGRGFDLVVVEIDPVSLVEPGRGEVARLAHRLWLLERETLHARLESLGVGVARWGDDLSLDAALEGVRRYRRTARLARA